MLFLPIFWSSCFYLVSAHNATSKRGLAFADPNTPGDLDNANQTQSQITWQYDWGSTPPGYLAIDNIEYIPMQWGSQGIGGFAETVKNQGAKTILAFNEPDFDQESNILPEDAANLWKQYLEPMKADGIRLGGPAVSGGATGQPWLDQFMQNCTGCSVDFIPLHWYGDGVGGFYDYLFQVHGKYPNTSIWVTEFASTSTNETEVFSFLNASISYLDGLPWIERYSWFGFFRPQAGNNTFYNLLGDDGSLNQLGQTYLGAKTVHTQVVEQPATKTFVTVNGADNPTQGLVTTYPAAPNAARYRSTVDIGTIICLALALVTSIAGTAWTLW